MLKLCLFYESKTSWIHLLGLGFGAPKLSIISGQWKGMHGRMKSLSFGPESYIVLVNSIRVSRFMWPSDSGIPWWRDWKLLGCRSALEARVSHFRGNTEQSLLCSGPCLSNPVLWSFIAGLDTYNRNSS